MQLIAPIVAHVLDGVEAEEQDALWFLQEFLENFEETFSASSSFILRGVIHFYREGGRKGGQESESNS